MSTASFWTPWFGRVELNGWNENEAGPFTAVNVDAVWRAALYRSRGSAGSLTGSWPRGVGVGAMGQWWDWGGPGQSALWCPYTDDEARGLWNIGDPLFTTAYWSPPVPNPPPGVPPATWDWSGPGQLAWDQMWMGDIREDANWKWETPLQLPGLWDSGSNVWLMGVTGTDLAVTEFNELWTPRFRFRMFYAAPPPEQGRVRRRFQPA